MFTNDLSVTGEFTAHHLISWEAFENRFPTWAHFHSAFLIALWLESEIWKWALYSHLNNLIKLSKLNNGGHNCMTNSRVRRVHACYLPCTSVHWIKYENWISKLWSLSANLKKNTDWVQFKKKIFLTSFPSLAATFHLWQSYRSSPSTGLSGNYFPTIITKLHYSNQWSIKSCGLSSHHLLCSLSMQYIMMNARLISDSTVMWL